MQSFMRELEGRGLLKRVSVPVSAELEITEIATRLVHDGGPGGSIRERARRIVSFGSQPARHDGAHRNRVRTVHPEEIGKGLIKFLEDVNPPSLSSIWRNKGSALNMLNVRPGRSLRTPVHQVMDTAPDLSQMPILKCWPEDGGRFITLPLVRSRDRQTGAHKHGHVPDAGLRRKHDWYAHADPEGRSVSPRRSRTR